MPEKDKNLKLKIRKILSKLFKQRGLSIYKIVVFGSVAKGKSGKDSDIDLIIVSKDFRGKDIFKKVELTTGIGRELVKKTNKPFDIMYYSDIEWDNGHSLIINAAKREGEVIYG
ncbi:MAG: nucleotidyltransferase domain-containing protein [bacterium]